MGTSSRYRESSSQEDSGAVEQQIEGFCAECTCNNAYHISDSTGRCVDCHCIDFTEDADSDLLDRLKGHILGALSEEEEEIILPDEHIREEWELPEPGIIVIESKNTSYFLGKVSRSCDNCGVIKLYKEFDNSRDPKILCKYCAYEDTELAMLAAMTDKERLEIAEMEDEILENEMAYDEALERQEMIDAVLRGLDE